MHDRELQDGLLRRPIKSNRTRELMFIWAAIAITGWLTVGVLVFMVASK